MAQQEKSIAGLRADRLAVQTVVVLLGNIVVQVARLLRMVPCHRPPRWWRGVALQEDVRATGPCQDTNEEEAQYHGGFDGTATFSSALPGRIITKQKCRDFFLLLSNKTWLGKKKYVSLAGGSRESASCTNANGKKGTTFNCSTSIPR